VFSFPVTFFIGSLFLGGYEVLRPPIAFHASYITSSISHAFSLTFFSPSIGGGGLPQSRDADILQKRIDSVYSMDEKMVIRKSHKNQAVAALYKELLGEPLSHLSHRLLHTHYFARPRKPPVTLKGPQTEAPMELGGDHTNTVYVVFGTQSGTAAQASKEIKLELQNFIGRSKVKPEPDICLVAANAMHPDTLLECAAEAKSTIFVTSTFGEGEFPEMMEKFWEYLETCKDKMFKEEDAFRFGVFGLGSSMYAGGDQFNKAARLLDQKLGEIGGERLLEVGLGDDQHSELYRGEMDKWIATIMPKIFGKEGGGASYLDPPEPLFKLSLAPGKHAKSFRPLPPNYHFAPLESKESLVAKGYDRPAGLFTFDLEQTGIEYDVGDHLALLPRNPKNVVERVLSLYHPEVTASKLLDVDAVDKLSESPFPPVLTAEELLTQYLDLCGRPSRNFFKQLFMFATTADARQKLRGLFERDNPSMSQEEFEEYTGTHTYADALCEFASSSLPPFEYLLSIIPVITPRLYSIASSPLYRKNKLELVVVLNEWEDANNKRRRGLATQFMFDAELGERFAIQIRTGILQPPSDMSAPVLMFGLGTGIAPFRGFLQHRESLMDQGVELGPATLYVGFRHEDKDYYLRDDYDEWIKKGVLTAVHPAFSHDHCEQRGGRLYFISDLISEKPKDIAEALQLQVEEQVKEPNVHVFYCGPALGIPETIQRAMEDALKREEGAGLKEDDAKGYMDLLVRLEDRFHTECF
jgi:NADPH-ferrihemoprotein reductase